MEDIKSLVVLIDQLRRDKQSMEILVDMETLICKGIGEAEMSAGIGEAATQKLLEEIKDIKSILKCGVCSDRPKEVVIRKCCHLFCNPCIQKNLELNHRKCPGCGTALGQNDVRFVKI